MKHLSSYPHIVRLPISRSILGRRFEHVFQACRYAAGVLSRHDCYINAVYEDHQRVGYIFGFRTPLMAVRLRLYHDFSSARPTVPFEGVALMRFWEIVRDRPASAGLKLPTIPRPRLPGVKSPAKPTDQTKPQGLKALAGLKR